eukprot:TRINITY_DN4996_c0_g1_i1.p5 TRINITY_DN4996_c0_g1~~TRINITY_DN4996_c0_g1_i1.p5  ORF type:complete len:66 (+),score=8.78 TRINITY_DN4996_c0_g1_i1:531-728(+)
MALVAGFFQMDFEDARASERRFYKLIERTGIVSAFLVLSDDRPADSEFKKSKNFEKTMKNFLMIT